MSTNLTGTTPCQEKKMTPIKLRTHVSALNENTEMIMDAAVQSRADKIILIVNANGISNNNNSAIDQITNISARKKIELEIIYQKLTNLPSMIKLVKDIIVKEHANEIFINISSGTPEQVIGFSQAAGLFNHEKNIRQYSCEIQEQKLRTFTQKYQIKEIPILEISLPEQPQRQALSIIVDNNKITKSELAQILHKKRIINSKPGLGNELQVTVTSMNTNIIGPLMKKGFIKTFKVGRKHIIEPTDQGKNASIYFDDSMQIPSRGTSCLIPKIGEF